MFDGTKMAVMMIPPKSLIPLTGFRNSLRPRKLFKVRKLVKLHVFTSNPIQDLRIQCPKHILGFFSRSHRTIRMLKIIVSKIEFYEKKVLSYVATEYVRSFFLNSKLSFSRSFIDFQLLLEKYW